MCIEHGDVGGDTGTYPPGVHKFRHSDFPLAARDPWVLEQKVAVMGVEDILLSMEDGV